MRVLIVEDEVHLRSSLAQALRHEGYVVDETGDGIEGQYMALELPLDLAIIDLGLPNINGIDLIKTVRKSGKATPIMILTARGNWQEKVEGLEAGADDYVTKPFQTEEVIARARALIRRTGGWSSSTLVFGPMYIDTSAQKVQLDGYDISLTAYEYRVLEYLALHAGRVISKMEITEHLYPDDAERDSNVLEVFIRRLRRKLDPENTLQPIETMRGQGYRFALERTGATQ